MDVVSCAVKFSVGEKIMYESPGIYIICRNKKNSCIHIVAANGFCLGIAFITLIWKIQVIYIGS